MTTDPTASIFHKNVKSNGKPFPLLIDQLHAAPVIKGPIVPAKEAMQWVAPFMIPSAPVSRVDCVI